MQFQLSDWSTIIPTFDVIWKFMQQMWLGMEFFVGRQVSSKKIGCKKNKQNKFGELSIEEIQEITDNATSVTTKKP